MVPVKRNDIPVPHNAGVLGNRMTVWGSSPGSESGVEFVDDSDQGKGYQCPSNEK